MISIKLYKEKMKKIFTLLAAILLAAPMLAGSNVQRPKLVIGLVVDQMRWDYLYYYYPQFGPDGLRRLVDEGYSYENTLINYVPTVTAIGHSSVYTGSVPALTGIAGNNFVKDGKKVYCCDDDNVSSVGSNSKEGKMSPRNLLASGIGDQLRIATDFKGKVIGIALKDRAAILPAGHAASAAYWWDQSAGHFITSTYYMKELPKWVKEVNKKIQTKPGTNVKTSVPGQENHDVYMELDRQVGQFLKYLDEKVGRGNYLLFLTADHGAAHNPNFLKAHNMPSGGLNTWGKDSWLNSRLPQLDEAIAKSGKKLADVKQQMIETLEQDSNILYVVDYDKVLTTSLPARLREMIVNGYNKKRSGDLFYVPRPDWEDVSNAADYRGTSHGLWNPTDAHIPFVLYGWHITHGQTDEPTHIVDIAPTICELLHIQMPNECIGDAKLPK